MTSSNSFVRCAVIGLGIGRSHAEKYLATPEARLAAVVDIDPNRLAPWSEKLGADACFTDYNVMLKKIKPDLVSVALPNFLHAPVTIAALRAGAHVLCEKPMAMNVAQALTMQREAKKAKRKLGINLSYRATPVARALKQMADNGFLGKPYHAFTQWTRRDGFPKFGSWFGQKKVAGGGPLIDLGVHRIDLAMWLMGGPRPVTVSAGTHHQIGVPRGKAQKQNFDVEDFAAGFIRFDTGATMLLEISWAGHQAQKEMMNTTVTGTDGTLIHRNDDGNYHFIGEYFTETKGYKLGGLVTPGKEFRTSQGEMVQAILQNTRPLADAEDGLRVQRVLDGLYKSAATGREVRVK